MTFIDVVETDDIDQPDIRECETAILDRMHQNDDRWRNEPFSEDTLGTWKMGWREADHELSGDEDAEFRGVISKQKTTYPYRNCARVTSRY